MRQQQTTTRRRETGTITVRLRLPALLSWTTRYVVGGLVVDIEHVWTLAGTWGRTSPPGDWQVRRVGPFILAERLRG